MNAYFWRNTITGTCDTVGCAAAYFIGTQIRVTSLNGAEPSILRIGGNVGGVAQVGGFLLTTTELTMNQPTGNLTTANYQAMNIIAKGDTNDNGSSGTYAGNLYATNADTIMSVNATFWNAIHNIEAGISTRTGSSVHYVDGITIILRPLNAVAGDRENVGFSVAKAFTGTSIATMNTAYAVGLYEADFPLTTTATIMRALPHAYANAAAGPSIAYGIHFDTDPTCNCGQVTFSGNAFDSNGFSVDGSGNLKAAAYQIAAQAFLTSPTTASWKLGQADVAAPVAQTLGVQGVATGTADTSGVIFTIRASQSTGTGIGGPILFQTSPGSSAGSTQNTFLNRMQIFGGGQVVVGSNSLRSVSNNAGNPLFEVQDNSATGVINAIAMYTYSTTTTNPANIFLAKSNSNTQGTQIAVATNNVLGAITADGSDGTNFQDSAQIQFVVDGTVAAGKVPGDIIFKTATAAVGTLTEAGRFTALQSFVLNNAAIATNATDGFIYLASGAGTPTGTPTTFTGRIPLYIDTTNSQLWLFMGGAWKQPKTPAAAATVTWQ